MRSPHFATQTKGAAIVFSRQQRAFTGPCNLVTRQKLNQGPFFAKMSHQIYSKWSKRFCLRYVVQAKTEKGPLQDFPWRYLDTKIATGWFG